MNEFSRPAPELATGIRVGHEQSADEREALVALRRFTRSRPPVERCELCGLTLAEVHPHLLNRQSRQIACACDACAILFSGQASSNQGGSKFLRVPRRVRRLETFAFTDLQWEAMLLPINLAFFLRTGEGGTAVFYPSPAGPIESLLSLPPWHQQFSSAPELASVEAEVEALLVNRVNGQAVHLIVPLDECYRLVGIIRTQWRGLSGGANVWQAVDAFFSDLQSRAGNGAREVRYA
jgi:hypothetical protein